MSTVYALIKMDETARVLERAKDSDMAVEAIYLDELNRRLGVYGVTVIDLEMTDNPTGALADIVATLNLDA